MENSASAIAPLLLRNFLTSIFILAEKSLFSLSQKYKLLQLLRCFIVSSFLFFLSLLPAFFSSLNPSLESQDHYFFKSASRDDHTYSATGGGTEAAVAGGGRGKGGGSSVSRALSQLLLIMNDIPVSSRKYEVVRSLAEKLIDENLLEGNRALREVNCAVLSTAFATSLSQLEAAAAEQRRMGDGGGEGVVVGGAGESGSYVCDRVSRLILGVKYFGRRAWCYAKSRSDPSRSGRSAEKLAAELLWLAQKMAASGCSEEAVCKWASASNLALLALSAEPRLQGSLVKLSAFLIKEAKEMGKNDGNSDETDSPFEQQHMIRHTKMKILMSWLPLLCRANNGTDAPILSLGERAELERTLEEIISCLDEEEEQEWVLSLWLHHFTYCPASDWPNLRSCYTRWYNASRAKLLLQSIN